MNYKNNTQEKQNILFWNVDTQYDFMRDDKSFHGSLVVKDAYKIEKNLEKLTNLSEDKNIIVINTADWHTIEDAEISLTPDFKKTYPPHCMANTKGAEYIFATNPKNPYIIDWQDNNFDTSKVLSSRNIVLYKNDFDVFKGNSYTNDVLDLVSKKNDLVVVYGVATNVCVNFAVEGLLSRGRDVYVVSDAIKELPKEQAATPLENILDSWKIKGAKLVETKDVDKLVAQYSNKKLENYVLKNN